jgi:plastocyanin
MRKSLLFKKWTIAALVLALAVGLALVATAVEKKPAGTTKMIIISDGKIGPATANITKGTTVIWLNNAMGNVNIFFSKGKEVEAVCAAPTRFALDADGKYNSGAIPRGATASVCFIEAGKYEYTVTGFERGTTTLTGKVVVK